MGFLQGVKNSIPAWRDSAGVLRYDLPSALTDLTMAEKLLMAHLSVTVAIRRLSHGWVESTGRVATFPNPVDPMAEVLPRFPSDATIARVRRGATEGLTRKQNAIYAVHREKVLDALRWALGRNPYYADVVAGPPSLSDFVEWSEIHGVKDLEPKAGGLP